MARLKAEGARLAGGLRGERRVPARGDGRVAGGPAAGGAADPRRDGADPGASSPPWRARGGRSRSSWPTCPRARRTAAGWRRWMSRRRRGCSTGWPATREARAALLSGLGAGELVATDTLDGVRMTAGVGRDRAPAPLGQRARAALLHRGGDARSAPRSCWRRSSPGWSGCSASRCGGARRRPSGRCPRPGRGRRPRPSASSGRSWGSALSTMLPSRTSSCAPAGAGPSPALPVLMPKKPVP